MMVVPHAITHISSTYNAEESAAAEVALGQECHSQRKNRSIVEQAKCSIILEISWRERHFCVQAKDDPAAAQRHPRFDGCWI
jgi:hypothetical protein